jgi:hypothetical protein
MLLDKKKVPEAEIKLNKTNLSCSLRLQEVIQAPLNEIKFKAKE